MSSLPQVDRNELDAVFQLCRTDQWSKTCALQERKPWIALTPMTMDNHITTTILHQAITSKGETPLRARCIVGILEKTPQAAAIKNGYGSLPLHVIAQRNTKMDSATKEKLIFELIRAYKGALTTEGGVGKRTPLHIIFTDYISPQLTRLMIESGREACFMKDKKGFLPAHVACSRHCSPEKLRMLLNVNPSSLYEKSVSGQTLLSLATSTATKSHPNYALIDELNRQLHLAESYKTPLSTQNAFGPHLVSSEESDASRGRLDSNDSDQSLQPSAFGFVQTPKQLPKRRRLSINRHFAEEQTNPMRGPAAVLDPVDLLLHFSRNGSPNSTSLDQHEGYPASLPRPSQYAEV